jgi:hypothetical protein
MAACASPPVKWMLILTLASIRTWATLADRLLEQVTWSRMNHQTRIDAFVCSSGQELQLTPGLLLSWTSDKIILEDFSWAWPIVAMYARHS